MNKFRKRQHWAIRLRKKLLRKGNHKTNSWVRDVTGWLEKKF